MEDYFMILACISANAICLAVYSRHKYQRLIARFPGVKMRKVDHPFPLNVMAFFMSYKFMFTGYLIIAPLASFALADLLFVRHFVMLPPDSAEPGLLFPLLILSVIAIGDVAARSSHGDSLKRSERHEEVEQMQLEIRQYLARLRMQEVRQNDHPDSSGIVFLEDVSTTNTRI